MSITPEVHRPWDIRPFVPRGRRFCHRLPSPGEAPPGRGLVRARAALISKIWGISGGMLPLAVTSGPSSTGHELQTGSWVVR